MVLRTTASGTTRRAGFTLLELVVVLMILVILATMISAKLDDLMDRANAGVGASNLSGISRFVQSYRTIRSVYPDGFDSCLKNGASGLSLNLEPALNGGTAQKLTTLNLGNAGKDLLSLNRSGITIVYDEASTFLQQPGENFTSQRTLGTTDKLATINAADPEGLKILKEFYPPGGTLPVNHGVVVLGLGRNNAILTDKGLLQEPPIWGATNQKKYYNRVLVVFEYDMQGGPTRMVGAIGADGTRLSESIDNFKK